MSTINRWTPAELPSLTGKTYLVTGGNTGLGFETAKLLAGKAATVFLTSRSVENGEAAKQRILESVPEARVSVVPLDLTDPHSIQLAAKEVSSQTDRLAAVINNAGVMQTPHMLTAEYFELQFATNHLGHFRLNAALFPLLEESAGRIVPVSSVMHKVGRINFADVMHTDSYDPSRVYSQSKLANLMYSMALHRRLLERGSKVTVVAAHPGYSATDLQTTGVAMPGGSPILRKVYQVTNKVWAQSATLGAYPLVLAAADVRATPGGYYGPTGFLECTGPVGEAQVSQHARVAADQERLWAITEELVGPFFTD